MRALFVAAKTVTLRKTVCLALLAGALQACAIAWPFDYLFATGAPVWWLQIGAMALWLHSLRQAHSAHHSFLSGWCFATSWLACTFWWLYVAMHTYGGLPGVLSLLALLGLAMALALYYAIASRCHAWLGARASFLQAASFPALWTLAELARGTWLTGFGWGAIGYAQLDGPLAAALPWLGVYGVGALAAWLASLVAAVLAMRPRQRVMRGFTLTAALLAAFWLGDTQSFTKPHGALVVALLQGNIAQDQKFEAGSGVPTALAWYAQAMQSAPASLVVAPETAIPLLPQDLPAGYWDRLAAPFSHGDRALLTGIPLGDATRGYRNAVLGLRPNADQPWQYSKHHLVPFGEFIPTGFRWFTRLMHIPLGDFTRGALGQPAFDWQGQRLGANVCYEDLYGEELGVRFLDDERAPTAFVNLSNLGWFGATVALDQHLQIARARALEFERPVVNATNTGYSALIDYRGRVTARIAGQTRGMLQGTVEGRVGTTPYAWWVARFGLAPLWFCGVALLALQAWRRSKV